MFPPRKRLLNGTKCHKLILGAAEHNREQTVTVGHEAMKIISEETIKYNKKPPLTFNYLYQKKKKKKENAELIRFSCICRISGVASVTVSVASLHRIL